jgi:cyclic lactone autoinducer peptide
MKKRFKTLLVLGVSIVAFIASISAANACLINYYQPEVPKSLQD